VEQAVQTIHSIKCKRLVETAGHYTAKERKNKI